MILIVFHSTAEKLQTVRSGNLVCKCSVAQMPQYFSC